MQSAVTFLTPMRILLCKKVISAATVVLADNPKGPSTQKEKRGAGLPHYGPPGLNLDPFNGLPGYPNGGPNFWNPGAFSPPLWDSAITSDLALGQVQLQATHNLALQVRSLLKTEFKFGYLIIFTFIYH